MSPLQAFPHSPREHIEEAVVLQWQAALRYRTMQPFFNLAPLKSSTIIFRDVSKRLAPKVDDFRNVVDHGIHVA